MWQILPEIKHWCMPGRYRYRWYGCLESVTKEGWKVVELLMMMSSTTFTQKKSERGLFFRAITLEKPLYCVWFRHHHNESFLNGNVWCTLESGDIIGLLSLQAKNGLTDKVLFLFFSLHRSQSGRVTRSDNLCYCRSFTIKSWENDLISFIFNDVLKRCLIICH